MALQKIIEVSAAIIRRDGMIFATQRGYGEWKDWWEFPGGKVEEGETPEKCLIREIKEELDTDIKLIEKIACVEYDYPKFHLSMHCFLCDIIAGSLSLLEHEDARWLCTGNLYNVRWLPADERVVDIIVKNNVMLK